MGQAVRGTLLIASLMQLDETGLNAECIDGYESRDG